MTINATGSVSLSGSTLGASTNLEMGLTNNATVSLDDSIIRGMVSKAAGSLSIDDIRGKTYIKQNVIPNSRNLFTTWGSAPCLNCTITPDTIVSPIGNTPLKMVVTGADPYIGSYNSNIWNLSVANTGQTWTFSVYVKADRVGSVQLFIFGVDVNSAYQFINNTTALNFTVTTEWNRIQMTHTFTNPGVAYIQVRLDGGDSAAIGTTYWFDGAQLEQKVLATPLI